MVAIVEALSEPINLEEELDDPQKDSNSRWPRSPPIIDAIYDVDNPKSDP